jgi:phosphoglycolate phosphatase
MPDAAQTPIRAVVFDLDGTLLDTLADIASSVNQVLAELSFPVHSIDEYRHFVGDGMNVLMQRVLPEEQRDEATHARAVKRFQEVYDQRWNIETRPYAGMRTLLSELTARGKPLAVLSNKPQRFTELCVQHLLSEWRFHPVFGMRAHVPRKPDPAGALEIAAALGVSPGECAYLGDTSIDMQTANAAGMIAFGAAWGFRSITELREHGASQILQHPCDLLDWL